MRSLIHILCLFPLMIWSQIPNHIVLGEKELANVDIYGVHVDSKNNLRIATNNGIFIYRFNQFEKLASSKEQRGESFFDLKEAPDGRIFAKNIKGQLFEIASDTIRLHYELHEDQQNSHFKYFIDNDNIIHISSMDFYTIDDNLNRNFILKSIENKHTDARLSIVMNTVHASDEIYLRTLDSSDKITFYTYENNNLKSLNYSEKLQLMDSERYPMLMNSKVNETSILIDRHGEIIPLNSKISVAIKNQEGEHYFRMNDGRLVALGDSKGLRIIYEEKDSLKATEALFPNTFISSCFAKGDQLFLGTFGGGLIIVPNIDASKINLDELLLGISVDNENNAYFSTRTGKVFTFNYELQQIDQKIDNVDHLIDLKNEIIDIDGEKTHVLTSVSEGTPRIKDFFETENGVWAIDAIGLVFIPFQNDTTKIPPYLTIQKQGKQFRGTLIINDFDGYSHIAIDESREKIYFNNYKHLFTLNNGKLEIVEIEGPSIVTTDLEIWNDKLIAGTQNSGIQFLKNNKVIRKIDLTNGLLSNSIKKIQRVDQLLYVLSFKGLQVVDLSTYEVRNIGLNEGVKNNLISNFAANQNQLTIVEKDGFYSISTDQLNKEFSEESVKFQLTKIEVNGELIEDFEVRDYKYTENAFRFQVDYAHHVNKEEAYYSYQLVGFDDKVQQLSTLENEIFYQSLPPGDYTFKIGLVFRNQQSEYQQYSFSILPPFWQRWWFYVLIVLIAGLIIYFFQQRKLKAQKRESLIINEMNSSKLTAIQSQMNPHFVFNALNSIQHLVIEGETKQAYSYITRFANLVRKTLEFSEVETIAIAQEIELLEIYLKLEKLRFGEEFEYAIETKNIVNCNVPPMLIQPFIENSLVHGLLHKRGSKKLLIELEVEHDILHCKIHDNGIGRAESKKINERQKNKPKSFALRAIDNRFRILQKYHESEIGYSYTDLSEGEYRTIVNMKIPIAAQVKH